MSAAITWRGIDDCRELFAHLRSQTEDVTPMLDFVGDTLTESAIERIADTKQAPTGTPWKPLNEKYAQYKSRHSSGGILEYTGNLLKSLTYNVSENEVVVGSNEEYAVYNQTERPFLGVSKEDNNVITKHIRELLSDN